MNVLLFHVHMDPRQQCENFLGKIAKSKDVSLETEAKTIHTLYSNDHVWMLKLDREEG